MNTLELDNLQDRERSNWVRLRTLVILRWIAILGQLIALSVSIHLFDLVIEVGLAAMAIGVSIIANLFSTFIYPQSKRLSEFDALVMLLFDLLQLCLLLYLTGGLNNPFAVLILAPVTIAATFLQLRNTLLLGLLAILIISALTLWHLPLATVDGAIIALPDLFLFGFWAALIIGVVFLGVYARQITGEMHDMSDALLATQMALAREQKLTDLGGVIAAAAHELGTPLATIKLVSSELLDDLEDGSDLREDVQLIAEQSDRCRDILRSMGRAGKDDLHFRRIPIQALVQEAAEPHKNRGKTIEIVSTTELGLNDRQPVVERSSEILHGLRNLIQNAVDFATSKVVVEVNWENEKVSIRIQDDGPGYPSSVIGRIGDPFVRRRRAHEDMSKRPEYEGMGLGLFISKTLLERSGARLQFTNAGNRGGAIVLAEWERDVIDPSRGAHGGALGENQPIEG